MLRHARTPEDSPRRTRRTRRWREGEGKDWEARGTRSSFAFCGARVRRGNRQSDRCVYRPDKQIGVELRGCSHAGAHPAEPPSEPGRRKCPIRRRTYIETAKSRRMAALRRLDVACHEAGFVRLTPHQASWLAAERPGHSRQEHAAHDAAAHPAAASHPTHTATAHPHGGELRRPGTRGGGQPG